MPYNSVNGCASMVISSVITCVNCVSVIENSTVWGNLSKSIIYYSFSILFLGFSVCPH